MTDIETQTGPSLDDLPLLEPSAPNVGTALRHYPIILVVSVLVCVGAAAVGGLARKPNYTATAGLQVGNIALSLPGAIGGLQTADEELATSYSREIDAPPVLSAVANQLRISQAAVLAALSSTPVPLSGDFTITAVSKSRAQAIGIANSASTGLIKYVATQNNNRAYVKRLWTHVQAAAAQVASANVHVLVARNAIDQAKGNPTPAELTALAKAQAALDTATINEVALRDSYGSALSQQTNTPQIVAPALGAASDRATKLEIFLFGGVVVGLVIGAGLAALWARRSASRLLG